MSKATTAINESVRFTRIVHMEADKEAHAELYQLCSDYSEGNEEYEFCGTDKDGDEWRVHMDRVFDSEGKPVHIDAVSCYYVYLVNCCGQSGHVCAGSADDAAELWAARFRAGGPYAGDDYPEGAWAGVQVNARNEDLSETGGATI